MTDSKSILETQGLEKYFNQETGVLSFLSNSEKIKAVDGVSLTLGENEVVGIIGESGCGKSTLVKTLMGLHEPTGGEVLYRERSLSEYGRADWKQFRQDVQIIFQDPFNSLDPKMTVEETLLEPLRIHGMGDEDRRIREALANAELQPVKDYLDKLPRQLSGGEKQRVSIARALVVEPNVLLADEPVSMLDVSTQASVLNLLSRLSNELNMSMIYISHDLSTVGYVCDHLHIMYLGRIIESGPTQEILENPKHPYAEALIDAVPIPDPHSSRERTQIEETPRDPVGIGSGCRFRDRCPKRMDICEKTPKYLEIEDGHHTACHLYYDHDDWANNTDDVTPSITEKSQ